MKPLFLGVEVQMITGSKVQQGLSLHVVMYFLAVPRRLLGQKQAFRALAISRRTDIATTSGPPGLP